MYIENYKEELMEYIKSSLDKLPYKSVLSSFDRIEITGEANNNGEFKVESGILFDMCNAENVVMSGCVWYDYGTIYIITKNEDYEHYYASNCLYYGHPDTSVGFEEFLNSQLPKVPVGILKLPERVA
jgi:hypothetical protein